MSRSKSARARAMIFGIDVSNCLVIAPPDRPSRRRVPLRMSLAAPRRGFINNGLWTSFDTVAACDLRTISRVELVHRMSRCSVVASPRAAAVSSIVALVTP